MSSFSEANQVRLMLKMKLSQHSWYSSSTVISIDDGFGVLIGVSQMDNHIRKVVPPVVNGVSVKAEVE
jgi:hypothetical protein